MSALGDAIVWALSEFLRLLFSPITGLIQTHADGLLRLVVGTPRPNSVFGAPTNGPWPAIYEYYWAGIMPLTLALYGLVVGLVIFLESTSYLFGSYHRSKLLKRAFTGLLGILSWWWIMAIALRFTDALTTVLVPSLADLSLFETLSFSALGVLGLVVTLSVDLVLFVLIALIYFTRQLMLYLFVLLMPLLIVFWIPGVGPFALVSGFMRRLAGFFVPFLFMTVPVALLFRLGSLLGASADLSLGGFGLWLTALIIPLAAVLAPLVLFWQAGALFFVADRTARHVSATQAHHRAGQLRDGAGASQHAGQNFARGVRGDVAQTRDGQTLLGTRGSRAHALGTRVAASGTRLRNTFRGGRRASSGGTVEDTQQEASARATDSSESDARSDFELLRNRSRSTTDSRTRRSTTSEDSDGDRTADDPPRYIN